METQEEYVRRQGVEFFTYGTGTSRKISFSCRGFSFIRPVFIETGTDSGYATIHALLSGFGECHTIDIDPKTVARAKVLFSGFPGITAHEGDSRVVLPRVIDPEKDTTFFLDAHGPDTPLADELKIITAAKWKRLPLVMVDDGGHDLTIDEIKGHLVGYQVEVFGGEDHGGDVVYCRPAGAVSGPLPTLVRKQRPTHQERPMATDSLGGGPTVVHLTYLPDGKTEWEIACMSGVTNFTTSAHHPNYMRSNDTRAVSCQACKRMPIFQVVKSREH